MCLPLRRRRLYKIRVLPESPCVDSLRKIMFSTPLKQRLKATYDVHSITDHFLENCKSNLDLRR